MRSATLILLSLLVIFVPIGLTGCGGSDDPTNPPVNPDNGNITDSINNYWPVSRDLQDAFTSLDSLMDQIESTMSAKSFDEAAVTTLVDSYVAQTVVVGAKMNALYELEDDILAYGDPGKGMFTDTVGAVAKGVYKVVEKTVVSSGQMVRTGWRVLSGSHSLPDALRAPDSGIPIVSDYAKRLQEHNAARDAAIIDAISRGDTEEGNVPIGSLQGETTAQKIEYYRNLSDNDPLKKDTRGNVHFWNDEEKQASVKTLKNFARDQVKNYAGATSGSEVLVEVGDQMLSQGQPADDKGKVRSIVKDVDTVTNVLARKTVLIIKRDQPEGKARVAIVDGIDPDTQIPLATGVYDVVIIAEGYVRSVKDGLEILKTQTTNMLQQMYLFASNSLILEQVACSPDPGTMDEPVSVTATAASVVGSNLTFAWTISGGTFKDKSQDGPRLHFTPTQPGTYLVDLQVTDTLGNSRQGSVSVVVTGAAVKILQWQIASEQFDDGEINPGEQVGVQITIANQGTEAVTGTPRLVGRDRIIASLSGAAARTLQPGGQAVLTGTINLPVDYSPVDGAVGFEFDTGAVVINQDLVFAVAFGIVIDPISSPVTERVLSVTGTVSNPSLATASLAVGGDIDQVYTLNLDHGRFDQDIALAANSGTISQTLVVTADAGSRHAESTASFTAQVPPAGLRVTLTWDTGGTDVDLWVTDPTGEACGYSHSSTGSGLNLDFDDTDGYGPENITTAQAQVGVYSVRAHYYYDGNDEDTPNPTGCTVVIRLNEGTPEETMTSYHGSLYETGDEWSVASVTISPSGKAALTTAPQGLSRLDPASLPDKR